MCRLFGFRSVFSNQIHRSLIAADNALIKQSEQHPDGWGVGYYLQETPHIVKSAASAFADHIFQRVSGVVSSDTVLVHIRKATLGNKTILNTHPFQFANWTFAHNGNIKNYSSHKQKLYNFIDQSLQKYVLGDSDSEVLFFLLLTELQKKTDLHQPEIKTEDIVFAIKNTVKKVIAITGELQNKDDGPADENYFTFILTNGKNMVAHQGGKNLHYSRHKSSCSEKDNCPYFSEQCETISGNQNLTHLLFSSEALTGENIWQPMQFREIIATDNSMQFYQDDSY